MVAASVSSSIASISARASLIGHILRQLRAPAGGALEAQRRIEAVVACIDPVEDRLTARLRAQRLQALAVFHRDDAPAHVLEHGGELAGQRRGDHGVQALPVVVDHPPGVPEVMLPPFDQRLVDVALVQLRIADQRDHAPLRPVAAPAMGADVVLHQAGERGHGNAEADRAGREIHVVDVLGARWIGLRAAEAAEVLQLVERLVAQQILDGVEHRRGVRLHRDAVLRPQDREIERGHDADQRRRRGLMPADLQPVVVVALVIGVVDDLGRQPQHLALDVAQHIDRKGLRAGRHRRVRRLSH